MKLQMKKKYQKPTIVAILLDGEILQGPPTISIPVSPGPGPGGGGEAKGGFAGDWEDEESVDETMW